jgi:hypothetical protein
MNNRREIAKMELVGTNYIRKHRAMTSSLASDETINKNLYAEFFEPANFRLLFAQKIFSRN